MVRPTFLASWPVGDVLGDFHQALETVLHHIVGHDAVEFIGRGAGDGLVFEAAGAVDFGFFDEVEHHLEIVFGFAGEADDEVGAHGQVGNLARQSRMRLSVFSWWAGRRMAFSTFGRGVLERNVEIRQHEAFGHQFHNLIDMGVGVDIVQAHPGAELAQFLGQIVELGLDRTAAIIAFGIDVDAIG